MDTYSKVLILEFMKSRKKRETEGSEMNGEANEENKDDDQDEDRIGKV